MFKFGKGLAFSFLPQGRKMALSKCEFITCAQQTPEWFAARESYVDENGTKKVRLGASEVWTALGYSKFKSSEELFRQKKTGEKDQDNENMKRGRELEPIAREWFREKYGKTVVETGLAISKDYRWLGASPDGIVYEGGEPTECLEIKGPREVYWPLLSGEVCRGPDLPWAIGCESVWPSHRAQMMVQMFVLSLPVCNYVVYPKYGEPYHLRIPYNEKYMTEFLIPRLEKIWQKNN